MQTQTSNTAQASSKTTLGPSFNKEAAALLGTARPLTGNALEAVSHAMMFR